MSDASGNLLAALKCLDRGVTVHVRIKDIDDTDDFKLTVEGDVTDLAGAGARFREVAPVGADQDSGEAQLDPWTKASRWLWAGYMYEPPLVGYTSATGIERKAPGPDANPATPDANLKGQYYCWNRTYDIGTGRWTTPDPAASPWENGLGYVSGCSTMLSDPSGLLGCTFIFHDDGDNFAPAWTAADAVRSIAGESTFGISASNWSNAFSQIRATFISKGCNCIKGIEFWGHGTVGSAKLNGNWFDESSIASHATDLAWIKSRWCCENSGFYFRSCETAQGGKGKKFITAFRDAIGASVSGHTHVISIPPHQPGKVTLGKTGSPTWADSAGADSWVEMPTGLVRDTGRGRGDLVRWPKTTSEIKDAIKDSPGAAVEVVGEAAGTAVEAGKGAATKGIKRVVKIAGSAADEIVGWLGRKLPWP